MCKEHGWLKAHGRQRTDSTHILAKVRALNRAECVVETLRHALNVLAVVAPDWLRARYSQTGWSATDLVPSDYRFPLERRNDNSSSIRWARMAGGCSQRSRQILKATGCYLSQQLIRYSGSGNKTTYPRKKEEPGLLMRIGWRPQDCSIPLRPGCISGPKRSTYWIGYKVHFTETCDDDMPRIMTQVRHHIGPIPDREALPDIHAALQHQDLFLSPSGRCWIRRCRSAAG